MVFPHSFFPVLPASTCDFLRSHCMAQLTSHNMGDIECKHGTLPVKFVQIWQCHQLWQNRERQHYFVWFYYEEWRKIWSHRQVDEAVLLQRQKEIWYMFCCAAETGGQNFGQKSGIRSLIIRAIKQESSKKITSKKKWSSRNSNSKKNILGRPIWS